MREDKINLWEYPADARVITTNGFVKNNGEVVMGRGCAREAVRKYPRLPLLLGDSLKASGNKTFHFWLKDHILTMPVKHYWWEEADMDLIKKSANELIAIANSWEFEVVAMPRPGCGNGKLDWKEVGPMLNEILDDRFVALSYGDYS